MALRTFEAAPALGQRAELGESPFWDAAADVLWWIDWSGGVVYRSDVTAGTTASFPVGPDVAAIAPAPGGRIAVALGHGFAEPDPRMGQVRTLALAEPEDTPTRMCDGKCDAAGRFWAGTSVCAWARRLGRALPVAACLPTEGLPPDPRLAGTIFAEYPQRENFVLAEAWWRDRGLDSALLLEAARSFRLGRHRLARVAEVDGVGYWNDSKATNFHAVHGAVSYTHLTLPTNHPV